MNRLPHIFACYIEFNNRIETLGEWLVRIEALAQDTESVGQEKVGEMIVKLI